MSSSCFEDCLLSTDDWRAKVAWFYSLMKIDKLVLREVSYELVLCCIISY